MDENRNVEIGRQPEERLGLVGIRIVALMARIDDDGAAIVLLHRAFQLAQAFVAAAGNAGRHRDELVGVLVPAFGEIPVGILEPGDGLRHGLAKPQEMTGIADHGPVEAGQLMGRQHILERHRTAPPPIRLGLVLGTMDMGVPIDQHGRSPSWRAAGAEDRLQRRKLSLI